MTWTTGRRIGPFDKKPIITRSKAMAKLEGKKLLLLGERDGVPGPAMADVFADSGAEILF